MTRKTAGRKRNHTRRRTVNAGARWTGTLQEACLRILTGNDDQVKRVYRDAAVRFHPDTGGSDEEFKILGQCKSDRDNEGRPLAANDSRVTRLRGPQQAAPPPPPPPRSERERQERAAGAPAEPPPGLRRPPQYAAPPPMARGPAPPTMPSKAAQPAPPPRLLELAIEVERTRPRSLLQGATPEHEDALDKWNKASRAFVNPPVPAGMSPRWYKPSMSDSIARENKLREIMEKARQTVESRRRGGRRKTRRAIKFSY